MKFGTLLKAKRLDGPEEFRGYYLRYDALKRLLKQLPRHHAALDVVSVQSALNRRLTPSGSRDEVEEAASEERFVAIVEEDLKHIGHWVTLQNESLHVDLAKLLKDCSDKTYAVDYLREQADEVGRMTCELDKLILLNYEGFLKIAKKHDKWVGLSTRPWMLARLASAAFFHERFDKIVSGLSDAYATLRLREHPEEVGVWAPPSEFNRNTTKYWVKPEDVLSLKCEMVKHFPVLIFGRKIAAGGGGPNQPSDSSLVTSVYLDNPSLDVYHTRLERKDGATLFRVRWYGPATGPAKAVYMERKMHRGPLEKKEGLLSFKARFKVQWCDVPDLLEGKLDLRKRVEEPMRAEGASEEDIAYAMNLAHECQQEIAWRGLQPVSTTVYYRTSFQLSSSNAVRSTLDCQLRMVDETSSRSSLPPGEWFRPQTADALKDVHEFPYSVLEIKLQGEAPEWVNALIKGGKITKCEKFSKYLHSIVALGHPVQKQPHWLGDDHEFLLLPLAPLSSVSSSSGPPSASGGPRSLTPQLMAEGGAPAAGLTSGSEGGDTGSGPNSAGAPSTGGSGGSQNGLEEGDAAAGGKSGKGDKKLKGRKEAAKEARKEEKKGNGKGSGSDKDGGSDKDAPTRAKTLVRKRVDPKTLFANERTMLQWLNMAVLLVFTSLALLATSTAITNIGPTTEDVKAVAGGAQLCGAILAPAAVLVMLYAMWQYFWRISRITDPDEDARFEDKYGPLILVSMIIIVCSVAIVISIQRFSWAHFNLDTRPASKHHVAPPAPTAMAILASGVTHTAQAASPQFGIMASTSTQQQPQQQQQQEVVQPPLQFGDPKSQMILLQIQPSVRAASWAVVVFCSSMTGAVMLTSRSPLFVAFRQQLRGGAHACGDEEAGLLGSYGGGGWSMPRSDWGGEAASYGSAGPSSVPAFEAAVPAPKAAAPAAAAGVSVSAGGFRRLLHADAAQRRWDQMVAVMLPDGRRMHSSSQIPMAAL